MAGRCCNRELDLLGFEAAPDLGTVVVDDRCPTCGPATRANDAERPEKLREGSGAPGR
ncbi:MAG TPA: hypothetical protein VGR28_01515 [Candidatus Thermoplasmatota archaeon]|nr:hypothetical protein [Candidatus Thermoplasmatota archaeon]